MALDSVNQSSRSAAAEDDGVDQIGVDSPRSGVATPQPDLHDKRLPGIMSYFNQVRASSFQRFLSGTFRTNGQSTTTSKPASPPAEEQLQVVSLPELPPSPEELDSWTGSSDEGPPLLAHEILEPAPETSPREGGGLHPYPTPPVSQASSLRNFPEDPSSQKSAAGTPPASRPVSLRHLSASDLGKGNTRRRQSLLAPLTATVNESSVAARHLSNPAGRPSTLSNSPGLGKPTPGHGDFPYESESISRLKKLTDVSAKKSGASTPTRALSSAHPSQAERQDDARQGNGDRIDRAATHTPTPPGAQAPAAKGKLTIKVSEARGLRRCRDPYVVVVFQRSELISAGPRSSETDDEAAIAAVAMGGVPIQRQGSDSGRPMAIPMRSRQSSNTSISDFNTFRNRNSRRSFTSPKWDAEAILYVSPDFIYGVDH